MIHKTPLESWIARKIGLPGGKHLSRRHLTAYQLEKIRGTLNQVLERSGFYRRRLLGCRPEQLDSLEDLQQLPFTTAADIALEGLQLLCVPQDEIARVVTLPTSGTTGQPKRLYFTSDDLELTLDFFHHGMSTFVEPGQRVLILLPGERSDSAGELLVRALERMGAEGFALGTVRDPDKVIEAILRLNIDCLLGIPVQILALARVCKENRIRPETIRSVLLTTDSIPGVVSGVLEEIWDCRVFAHYGMTETGLGGGVECEALCGYHMREADLYFEIVDPGTGLPLPEGEWGEVVFTTLTRTGMPLVRYRTGDISRFLTGQCPCGSILRRMDRRSRRSLEARTLRDGGTLSIHDLDEPLLALPGLINYHASLTTGRQKDVLKLDFVVLPAVSQEVRSSAGMALLGVPAVRDAVKKGVLDIEITCTGKVAAAFNGAAKRTLHDERKRNDGGKCLPIHFAGISAKPKQRRTGDDCG